MLDLTALADLGRASVQALWLPVGLWTALALAVEAGLRLGRARAALALPVRGAVLAALPLAVAVPALLNRLAPEAARAVTAWTPAVQWLPEITVGGPAPTLTASDPAALDVALGLAVAAVLGIALVCLARLAAAVAGVIRARQTLAPADAERQRAVDGARRRLGVTRPVVAVVAPEGAAPFTVGWRRPLVALPGGLDPAALEVAAVHEVAHVRQGDFAWHLAQRVVASAFAAHPLVWVLGRGLDLDRERAADALVLAACPGRRRTYADLLFSYAALPAPTLALGAATGSSFLKHRIDAMTSPLSQHSTRVLRLGRLLGAGVLLIVAAVSTLAAAPGDALSLPPVARAAVVQGTVTDADTGEPISGANLQIVGSTVGAASGADGRFRLDAADGAQVVRVSAAGYESRTVRLADGQHELDVALTASNVMTTGPDSVRLRNTGTDSVRVRMDRRQAEIQRRSDDGDPSATAPDVYDVAEVQPELIGGLAALQALVEYPKLAKEAGIQGTVILQFVVNEEGRVTNPTAVRSPDDMLSEAALAAVRQARFTPGRQRGEPVKVRFAVPITFRLPGEEGSRQPATPAPDQGEVRQRLPQSGTDLTLLENESLVRTMHARTLAILDARGAASGTATVRYTLLPDGRTVDIEMVEDTDDGVLGGMARGLVGMMRFKEDRRPPQRYPGATLRLDYVRPN